MTQDEMKKAVAMAAIKYVEEDSVIGVGSGSTVAYFIEALATIKNKIEGAVASSETTATLLKAQNIPIIDSNTVPHLPLYIDGADEVDHRYQLIKGGGGALTREKILAQASKKFLVLVDETKIVDMLGAFPVAVEVLPFARSFVGRELVKLGGEPEYREGFKTDNGNIIIDVYNLELTDPSWLEQKINHIPGVVCNGIFALKHADIVLVASEKDVAELTKAQL